MRTIKFRVFNKKTHQWIHGPNSKFCLDGCNLFGEIILLGEFMNGIGLDELNDCVPCEFTGLTDKNGRGIFENDIVYGELDLREYDEYGRQYTGDLFTFKGPIIYKAPEFICDKADFPLDSYTLEVVGNIFEKPE